MFNTNVKLRGEVFWRTSNRLCYKSALSTRVGVVPFADFALFGPHGNRHLNNITYLKNYLDHSGSLRVCRTTLLLLGAVPSRSWTTTERWSGARQFCTRMLGCRFHRWRADAFRAVSSSFAGEPSGITQPSDPQEARRITTPPSRKVRSSLWLLRTRSGKISTGSSTTTSLVSSRRPRLSKTQQHNLPSTTASPELPWKGTRDRSRGSRMQPRKSKDPSGQFLLVKEENVAVSSTPRQVAPKYLQMRGTSTHARFVRLWAMVCRICSVPGSGTPPPLTTAPDTVVDHVDWRVVVVSFSDFFSTQREIKVARIERFIALS